MGFALNALANQVKADTIFRRSIDWLMSGVSSAAQLTAPPSVDFGSVNVGGTATKTITVTNDGSASVTVQNVSITGAMFSTSGSGSFTLAAGESHSIDVTFTPTSAGTANGTLTLSLGEGSQSIQLTGSATDAGGVEGTTATSTSFTASPNPFHGATKIEYTPAAGERDVTFSVVDLLGREVAKLVPTASTGGLSVTFDGSTVAAGTYVVVANSSTGSREIRVVNAR
jgi:hypothetical protein